MPVCEKLWGFVPSVDHYSLPFPEAQGNRRNGGEKVRSGMRWLLWDIGRKKQLPMHWSLPLRVDSSSTSFEQIRPLSWRETELDHLYIFDLDVVKLSSSSSCSCSRAVMAIILRTTSISLKRYRALSIYGSILPTILDAILL